MKTKKQKKESLNKLNDRLSKAKIAVITSFARQGEKGLSVKDMREIKKSLKGFNSEYVVEKKTLLDKALVNAKKKMDTFSFQGSLGVMYVYGDEYATTKALHQFAKKFPVLKFFAGIYGDQLLSEAQIVEMAKMPSREVLLGRLVGMLSYPIKGLAVVLDQITKTK